MISPLSEKQCGGQTAIPDSNNVYVSLSLSLRDPRLESVLRLLCSVSLYLRFSVSSASPSLCVSMFLSFCLHLCLCLCLSLVRLVSAIIILLSDRPPLSSFVCLRFCVLSASACASVSASLFPLVFNRPLFIIHWF